jgi:hypothetical protein
MFKFTTIKTQISQTAAVILMALIIGALYYWLTRPVGSAVFLKLLPSAPLDLQSAHIGRWLDWLPTFIHVFAFSLLTWLVFGRRHELIACTLWGVINAMFELGQALPSSLIRYFPEALNLHNYLLRGVFDLLDLVACALGSLLAWTIIRQFQYTKQIKEQIDMAGKKSAIN